MGGQVCWCGKRTILSTIREQSLADTGPAQVRLCPEHGEFWTEADRPNADE